MIRGESVAGELRGGDGGAGRRGEPVAQRRHLGSDSGGVRAHCGEQRRRDAVALGEERAEQVCGADVGVAGQRGGLHSRRDRLLSLGGGVEAVHPRVLLRENSGGRNGPSTETTSEKLSLFRSG